MANHDLHEPFPLEAVWKILQLPPEEESILKAYVSEHGLTMFFQNYAQMALSQDTLIKVKALAALLEAHYACEDNDP